MPLPAALAVRLSKRGILTSQTATFDNSTQEEEVIAEDYDDRKGALSGKPVNEDDPVAEYTPEEIQYKIKGYPGCPNKYNIHHECSSFCKEKYGNGILTPEARYVYLKNKMLMKYPLPEGWQEVYDPGTGRYYYWECKTDAVSWLPPGHPKHVATEAACVLREGRLAESENEASGSEEENSEEEEVSTRKEKRQQQIEQQRAKGRSKVKENDLDPMDPAAYSDIPRGKWSAGLAVDTKSGVDSTVTGPLYQQRPYPSPGDVLRRNKGKHKSSQKTSSTVSFPELPPAQ